MIEIDDTVLYFTEQRMPVQLFRYQSAKRKYLFADRAFPSSVVRHTAEYIQL
jgi:hypothetical protein